MIPLSFGACLTAAVGDVFESATAGQVEEVRQRLVTYLSDARSHLLERANEELEAASHNANCSPWCEGDHPPVEEAVR